MSEGTSEPKDRRTDPDFDRYFFLPSEDPPLDDDGFVQDAVAESLRQAKRAFRLQDLAQNECTFIVGAPYTGKSYALRKLDTWIRSQSPGDGRICSAALTDLRLPQATFQPPWPSSWSADPKPLLWSIDALDEGEERSRHIGELIVDTLRKLDDRLRRQLHIVITCREQEVPPQFQTQLEEVMKQTRVVTLGPLGRAEARRLAGSAEAFDSLCRLLREHRVSSLAGLPAVVEQLRGWSPGDGDLEPAAALWRRLLEQLLEQHLQDRVQKPTTELPTRFATAQRLGLFLTFGDFDEISDERAVSPVATLARLFPDHDGSLLPAARDASRSAIFQRIATGFGVRHRHVREWLAAFALRELVEKGGAPQVRSLLSETTTGRLVPAHRPLAVALRAVLPPNGSPSLREWLERELRDFGSAVLDGLMEAAGKAPHPIGFVDVEKLASVPAGEVIKQQLARFGARFAELTESQRGLLFSAGMALSTAVLVDLAMNTVVDRAQTVATRLEAFRYLVRVGPPHRLTTLSSLLDGAQAAATPGILQEYLLTYLHSSHAWTTERALEVVARSSFPVDRANVIVYQLAGRMNRDTAFGVLDPSGLLANTNLQKIARDKLYESAADCINATDLTSTEIDRLVMSFVRVAKGDWDRFGAFRKILKKSSALRHAAYIATESMAEKSHAQQVWMELRPEDAAWLVEELEHQRTPGETLAVDAVRVSEKAHPSEREAFIARITKAAPQAVAKWEKARRDAEDREREWEASLPPSQPRMAISEAIESILSRKGTDEDRLSWLGWLCATSGHVRPNDIEGTFEELPKALQERVVSTLEELLVKASPTPIPMGQSFPGTIMFEAAAFERVLKERGDASMTEGSIRKWLPATLRSFPDGAQSVIEIATRRAPEAARAVFAELITAQLGAPGERAFYADRAPAELWESGLSEDVTALLRKDSAASSASRAALLSALVRRSADAAREIAIDCSVSADAVLRTEAARVLLLTSPRDGIEVLTTLAEVNGAEALLDVAPVFGWPAAPRVQVRSWPADLQERLLSLLFTYFPGQALPARKSGQARWVGALETLADVRGALLGSLLDSTSPEARAALQRLSQKEEWIADRLKQMDAEIAAAAVLASASGESASPSAPPSNPVATAPSGPGNRERHSVSTLLKIVSSADYRLCRSNEELSRVLSEFLERLEGDIKADLRILYPEDWARHASEDVLQTYLWRRLNDGIPGKVVDREAWVPFNNRPDLRAEVRYGASVSRVFVEIKWSDDARVYTAVGGQLGRKYLIPTETSHGVYVVAWCGRGASRRRKRPASKAEQLRWISENVLAFEEKSPGYRISPLCLNAEPQTGTASARPRSLRKRTGRRRRR
jgi:hypothetical protein